MANTKRAKQSGGPVEAMTRYFRETRGELRKVTWPTREEAWRLTLIVLAVSAVMAVFLGVVLDASFSNLMALLVNALAT